MPYNPAKAADLLRQAAQLIDQASDAAYDSADSEALTFSCFTLPSLGDQIARAIAVVEAKAQKEVA